MIEYLHNMLVIQQVLGHIGIALLTFLACYGFNTLWDKAFNKPIKWAFNTWLAAICGVISLFF